MPKTIAITPSWYWPAGIPRVSGTPPFSIYELCVLRNERDHPNDIAMIDGSTSLTFGELRHEVDVRARALALAADESRKAVLPGELTFENVLHLLAGLAARVQLRISPPGVDPVSLGSLVAGTAITGGASDATPLPPAAPDTNALPAVAIDGAEAVVLHSNRSLLAAAISMMTFLDARRGRPWLATLPLSRWEGLMSALIPLYLGSPLVIPPLRSGPDDLLGLVSQHQAGYLAGDLEEVATATREAKRAAKDARRVLESAVLAVDGPFDPDQRRRVAKGLECAALTFWGMPETGPVFASHSSWYMDESVGIPMTNAHVVPSDPRSGQPIQALWELVESAEVTVFSPSLMCGYEDADATSRFAGHRFRTGMIASSDANGMIYLLGD
ncbi:MAG TPA: AMP-binding protein [Tepidiformaceae bacterium]